MSARARARDRETRRRRRWGGYALCRPLRSLLTRFANRSLRSPLLILILIIPPRFLSLAIFFDSLFSAREEGGNLERNLLTGGHFVDIGGGEEEGLDVFEV